MGKNIILLIFAGLILTVIPVIIYVLFFIRNDISIYPESWAYLGDFIGGTSGLIVSILSLVVLTILTIKISRIDSSLQMSLADLHEKRKAYDLLASYIPMINSMPNRIKYGYKNYIDLASHMIAGSDSKKWSPDVALAMRIKSVEMLQSVKDKTQQALIEFNEYRFFLKNFKVRYGHLFEINPLLISNALSTVEEFDKLLQGFDFSVEDIAKSSKGLDQSISNVQSTYENHMDELVKLINDIIPQIERIE